MFDRLASPLDLPSIPLPDSGLIGFHGYRDCVECWPVYRVTQADWDELPGFWIRRRSMTKLDVVRRELNEVSMMLMEITGEKGEGVYTEEFRKRAKRVAEKVNQAIDALYKKDAD